MATARSFFRQRHILEVETPILSAHGNPDPNINSFTTDTDPPLYLRNSPEFPLKRLLAAGYGDCYELGKVFRQAESGPSHNPEFTMLEWYRLDWTWKQLAEEVIEFIHELGGEEFGHYNTRWVRYADLFEQTTGLNPLTASAVELNKLLVEHKVCTQSKLEKNDALDLIVSLIIQPELPQSQISIIHNYPINQAALAARDLDDPKTALRFEIYLGSMELANGYQELIDTDELRQRMEADNQQRLAAKLPVIAIDSNLLAAQQHGLPSCAGVALGFDRLFMAITGSDNIADCLAFEFNRA